MKQLDITVFQILFGLCYLIIIPVAYGYLERRHDMRSLLDHDRWYEVIAPPWAFIWPLAFIWLVLLSLCRGLYTIGQRW
jgi:hypothetical protein